MKSVSFRLQTCPSQKSDSIHRSDFLDKDYKSDNFRCPSAHVNLGKALCSWGHVTKFFL